MLASVKGREKGILLGLHDPLRIQALGEDAGQSALADSDRAFDCDVAGKFEKLGHGLDEKTARRIYCFAPGSNCEKS